MLNTSNNNNNSYKGQEEPAETPKKKHVDCSIQKINWTTHDAEDDDDDDVAKLRATTWCHSARQAEREVKEQRQAVRQKQRETRRKRDWQRAS